MVKKEMVQKKVVKKKLTAKQIEELKNEKRDLQKKVKENSRKYIHEFRKTVATALISAFAFLIALSWRDVILEFAESMKSVTHVQGNLLTAIFVTFISIVGIMFITKYVADKAEK